MEKNNFNMDHVQTELTPWQKLHTLSYNYYQGARKRWIPAVGDYYTSCRADLQLYRIVREDEKSFYTVYCNQPEQIESWWLKIDFLNSFGEYRCHVSEHIFEIK
jgi:hypothetical protein